MGSYGSKGLITDSSTDDPNETVAIQMPVMLVMVG
jgi:hypothetical protein